jgi:membrane-anchored mycosin MYCP
MHRAVRGAVRWTASIATCVVILGLPYTLDVPAVAAAACGATATPAPAISDPAAVPWAIAASGVDGLAGVADGAGQTVAVIDSGVSPLTAFGHRVLHGHDLLGSTDGRTDCVGHGTAVASIIAAAPAHGIGFRGLAPAAKILPVRVTEAELVGNEASGDATTAAGLGDAITWAVDHGADVLNISVVVGTDDRTLRTAIARAIDKGVVVVASVGNSHGASGPDPTPYPADYPGVIGVGSIDSTGERSSTSEVGDFLDVVAPGGGVTADRVPSGLGAFDGTSFAVPYVAATAALIRQEFPGFGPDQVAARIFATTDRPPIDASAADYGHGIVDPYRAVAGALPGTDVTASRPPFTTSPPHIAGGPVTAPAAGIENPGRQRSIVAVTAAIALIMLAFGWTLTAAHRRRLDQP